MSRIDRIGHAPAASQMPRQFSLDAQIEEVDYELRQRQRVYGGIAARNPSRRSELDYHAARMAAVRQTLCWLRQFEDDVRAFVAARKRERENA